MRPNGPGRYHLCFGVSPAKWEQLRTGHWAIEHFLAYFVATSIVWLGWRRPLLVAGGLMIAAVLLEACKA